MEKKNHSIDSKKDKKRFGVLQVLGLLLLFAVITSGITILVLKFYLFPSEFKPVSLNAREEQVLSSKLEHLDSMATGADSAQNRTSGKSSRKEPSDSSVSLTPEPYSEKDSKRQISFTERELNALLANNTDLARKLAIDLSEDLISAKLILPLDEDFPIFGGKTLRVRAGVVFSFDKGRPLVMLKGVTIMGVPLPNAWLGGIKNVDLVQEFGADKGFWKAFSDGVEDIKVEEGHLRLRLRE